MSMFVVLTLMNDESDVMSCMSILHDELKCAS